MSAYGGYGTGTPGPMQSQHGQGDVHETVGAYALGILDDAEATAFVMFTTAVECANTLAGLRGEPSMTTERAKRALTALLDRALFGRE